MALGALSAPGGNVGFDAEGTSMVPISAGTSTIKIKSPLENLKDTFVKDGIDYECLNLCKQSIRGGLTMKDLNAFCKLQCQN